MERHQNVTLIPVTSATLDMKRHVQMVENELIPSRTIDLATAMVVVRSMCVDDSLWYTEDLIKDLETELDIRITPREAEHIDYIAGKIRRDVTQTLQGLFRHEANFPVFGKWTRNKYTALFYSKEIDPRPKSSVKDNSIQTTEGRVVHQSGTQSDIKTQAAPGTIVSPGPTGIAIALGHALLAGVHDRQH